MNYRSINDVSYLSTRFATRIPPDVDLVVGIPRSGMLAASIISLKLNLPLTDLYSFLRNDDLRKGSTRTYKFASRSKPQEAKKILLVDDSISTGKSMQAALEQVRAAYSGDVVSLAVFAQSDNTAQVDVHFEAVPQPRLFEWNIMHHPLLMSACLDIDGVLCEDPTAEQNDDGPRYIEFLNTAKPLFIPSTKVAALVTSRLEKYRGETEAWLARHGVQYETLYMVDLPSAEERRRLNIHHKFKAEVYGKNLSSRLFIESEEFQAQEIMRITGKPVFCIATNQMYVAGNLLQQIKLNALRKGVGLKRRIKDRLKKLRALVYPKPPMENV
ncbi:phosphoribosyltransferase family protein [Pseudomonas kuykendallii]|uniref:phosphoribosyltransferase family protein n=1 Tax=Pseudomonas kuykendallii TaxID=1007099 RepID=UPI0028D7ECE8|nr:phosphoribosyltransferase family protein [Pseudomonas kuykendallii]